MQLKSIKVKARWATAGDPDEPGQRFLVAAKGEGVWPLEPVPSGFQATKFDGTYLHGIIPKPPKCIVCGGDLINVNGYLMCENHMEPGGGWK